jgi:hypothetical protein
MVKISKMLNTKCVYVRCGVKIMLDLVLKVLKVIVSLLPFCWRVPFFFCQFSVVTVANARFLLYSET